MPRCVIYIASHIIIYIIQPFLFPFTGIHGQTCSETFNLTDDLSINASLATSCIRCIIGGQFMTDVQWIAEPSIVITDATNGVSVTSMPGVLVVTDADAFFNSLGIPVRLQCGGGVDDIYPAGKWL